MMGTKFKPEINLEKLLDKFDDDRVGELVNDLSFVVNKNNIDNYLNTPDYIIALHLFNYLVTLKRFTGERDNFNRKDDNPPPPVEKGD